MSESTTIALPLPGDIASAAVPTAVIDRTATQSFAFTLKRRRPGLAASASGAALLATGVFLLVQIGATPGLATQLAILGSLCTVSGVALLARACRDLFGRLQIDANGIALTPTFAGFNMTWSELKRWDVQLDNDDHSEFPCVRLWTHDNGCPLFIPSRWLSSESRDQIHHALFTLAADKRLTK